MLAGGVDTLIHPDVMRAFDAMTVLVNTYNHQPERASRPFDADRDGFVIGEGAAVLVLESLEHAQERGGSTQGLPGDGNLHRRRERPVWWVRP